MRRAALVAAALAHLGCGGPAIVDASRTVAELRGCEPAQLTMAETPEGFAVAGCGEPGVYTCSGGTCTPAGGAVDSAWIQEAMGAMAAIESDVLECNGGAAVTVQVLIDSDGRVNGLASHPELGAEERLCVGRVVYDNVTLEEGRARLVAYEYGGAGADVAPEPSSPPPAPAEGGAVDAPPPADDAGPREPEAEGPGSEPGDGSAGTTDVEDEALE